MKHVRTLPQKGRILPATLSVLAVIMVILGSLAAVPVNRELRRGLEAELRNLETAFEARSGFTLRYESLSPSILAGLTAKNLVIGTADGRKVLSARKVALRFNAGALFFGRGSPFVTSLSIEGADAKLENVDIDRLSSLLGGGASAGGGLPKLPPIRFEAQDLRLDLPDFDGLRLVFAARHLDIDSRKDIPSLSLDGSLKASLPGLGDLAAELGVTGDFSKGLDAARIRVKVSARTGDFDLRRQDFDLSLDSGVVELRKVRNSSPMDLYGRYDLASRLLSVNLKTDSFRPDTLFAPSGRLSFLSPWFREPWSAALALSMKDFDPLSLRYSGSLAGRLPASLAGGAWDVSLDASGDSDNLVVKEARAKGPEGAFEFSGRAGLSRRLIEGRLDADAAFLEGRLPVKASLDLSGSAGKYRVAGSGIEVGGVAFGSWIADIGFDSRSGTTSFRLSTQDGQTRAPAAASAVPAASTIATAPASAPNVGPAYPLQGFVAEGSFVAGSQPLLECALSFGRIDGAALGPLLSTYLDEGPASLLASLSISGSGIVRSDLSHFSWSTNDLAFSTSRLPGFRASLSASGSDLDIRLRNSTFSYKEYSAGLSGSLALEGPGMLSFDASLLYAGVTYGLKGSWVRGSLNVSGDFGLAVTARAVDGVLVGSLGIGSLPLPVPGLPLSVSANASFRFVSSDSWSLALSRASVIPSALGGSVPGFSCSGLFGPEGGSIATARLFDRISSVEGTGSVSWKTGPLSLSLKLGTEQAEHYFLGATLEEGKLSADLAFGASPLIRFVHGDLSGALDGRLQAEGPLDSLVLTYDLSLRQGKFAQGPIDLHLAGKLGASGFGLSDGRVLWQGLLLSSLKGGFDPSSGKGTIAGRFNSAVILPGSSFNFSADIASRVSHPAGPFDALADCLLSGSTSDFSFGSLSTPRWPFGVDISSRGVFIKGGPGDDFVLSLPSDGSFVAKAKAPFPILVDLQGRIKGEKIDAEAHGLSIDMPMLVALVGQLPVNFKGGRLTGDLMITGQAADPEFSGALQLVNCELSMPGWISETAGPVSAPVVVDGKRLFLQAPSVPILSSHFALDFELDFEGWLPTGVKVGLKSLADTKVPIDTNILGVAIKGFAVPDIELSILGPVLSVKGKLALLNTDVVVTPQTLAQAPVSDSPQQTLLDIDLGIETARGVHFYFPDRNYPVIAGNVVPGNKLTVRYDQARDDLSFKGEIDARGGDAFYIQRNFFLRSAKIVFNESSGKDFDPRVSMLAELRDSTADGPITVTLRADNQPISVFKPSITSEPAKSEADIALILGQGLLALDEPGGLSFGRIALAGSEFVPQLNVTKAFESRIRDALNLDVLYFNSQALQRLIVSLSGTGNQNLSTLSDYLKETYLFAGKYLSDSVFLHGSARLDADPLVPAGSLGIVSEIGVDFETPFGLLQWTFQPRHPEQLFVDDQSLSLSWRLPLK